MQNYVFMAAMVELMRNKMANYETSAANGNRALKLLHPTNRREHFKRF